MASSGSNGICPVMRRSGLLVNLGNTAPLRGRHQLLVIHDAGDFSTPEAYSRKFGFGTK